MLKKSVFALMMALLIIVSSFGGVAFAGKDNGGYWYSAMFFGKGAYDLGTGNTGNVTIEFDFMPTNCMQNFGIGYADNTTLIDDWSKMAMIITNSYEGETNYFVVRNAKSYVSLQKVYITNGRSYHFKLVTDTAAKKYNVYVTPDGETEIALALNCDYRTGAPAMANVGRLSFTSDFAGAYVISNHTPAAEDKNKTVDTKLKDKEYKGFYTVGKSGDADFLTTDYSTDAECIQAALDAIPSGSRLIINNGIYNITEPVFEAGKDIDLAGSGEVMFNIDIPYSECIGFSGNLIGYNRYLAADTLKGTYAITLDTAADIRAGDLIRIINNKRWAPDDTELKNMLTGEMYMVDTVSGSTVTITEPLMRDYLVSDRAVAMVYRPVKVSVENIQFIQNESASTVDKDTLILYACAESSVKNCKFENAGEASVQIKKCYDMVISDCTIRDSNKAGNGYGVSIADGSAGIRVLGNYIENCRHCIMSGTASMNSGLNRGIVISDNIIIGSKIKDANVIDAHQTTIDYTVTNNIIYPYSDSTRQYAAFYNACQSSVFSNNYVYGGSGVHQRGSVPGGVHVISNNRVDGGALYLGVRPVLGEAITITGNDARNSQNWGILVEVQSFKQYNITGNTIYNCVKEGIKVRLPAIAADASSAVIADNNISKIGETGISISRESIEDTFDCTVNGNVIQNANQKNGGYYGIVLVDINGAVISDNRINNTLGTTAKGIGELQKFAGSDWNYIHHNSIRGTDDAINLMGANSIDADNITTN